MYIINVNRHIMLKIGVGLNLFLVHLNVIMCLINNIKFNRENLAFFLHVLIDSN